MAYRASRPSPTHGCHESGSAVVTAGRISAVVTAGPGRVETAR